MVINTILGGYFGSRLMKNIREEKGFTYGIGSAIASTQQTGVMIIASEVNHENTSEAIDEIFKEIDRLSKEPVGAEELETVRNYMLGNIVRKLDGPFALAVNYKTLWEYGLDNSFNYKLIEKIKNITPDEIMSLAQTYYNIDDFTIVTAGEK
ncbi:MAG: insulinase family protein [Bacteroidales bacterium]|nr:insulinase family protein [Bacteroidales bacterium]